MMNGKMIMEQLQNGKGEKLLSKQSNCLEDSWTAQGISEKGTAAVKEIFEDLTVTAYRISKKRTAAAKEQSEDLAAQGKSEKVTATA